MRAPPPSSDQIALRCGTIAALLVAVAAVPAHAHSAPSGNRGRPITGTPYFPSRRTVLPAGVRELVAHARLAHAVPSFSRQTGLPCSACHYQFPQLTPFGRLFKLNGYSLMGLKPIVEPNAKKGAPLSLLPIPPLSIMLVASESHLTARRPGAQNDATEFPQQLSLFLGGALTPHIGSLFQLTYSGGSGTISIDNSDIRYVDRHTVASHDLVYGLALHNNPTVQDPWNTTPAWGFPFIASPITPGAIAGTAIDGRLAQQVVGLGGYALWNNMLYMEATGYRTALQPGTAPADSSAANAVHGVTPYWRVALQHQFGATYGMIGTYGLYAHLYPTGISGPTNSFADVAFDAQLEHPFHEAGVFVLRSTWINERQTLAAGLPAGGAAQLYHTLNTARINATFEPSAGYGASVGYFSTTGTRDSILYAPGVLTGSRSGRPSTKGIVEELDFNPWQNTRVGLQAVQFSQFNGTASNYDGFGRPASGNNTVYVFVWVAF